MDVSCVIVSFNGGSLILACLESLPAGVETIVVDNGSTDGSADAIAAKFPSVRLMRNRSNRGFTRAANQGLAAAKGKVLCVLHQDARLGSGALETLCGVLERDPELGIAEPASKRPGLLAARRALLERIGPLDERLFLTSSIADWKRRAREAGFRLAQEPAAAVERPRQDRPIRAAIEKRRDFLALSRKRGCAAFAAAHLALAAGSLGSLILQTLTLFRAGAPRRWLESLCLLAWQVCGCPRKWGLSEGTAPRYLRLRDGWFVAEERLEGFGDFDRHFSKARVIKDYKHKKMLACVLGDRTYLVKVYKRSGVLRRIKAAVFGSRAKRELRICRGILERGIPTAPVVAVGERGPGSCVVFERLADWAQLQETLLSAGGPAGPRRRLLVEYGKFARWVHDLGVWQYDFNPSNVLVKDCAFKLIDFERMELRHRALPARERIYLLAKMNRLAGPSRTDRLRFLRGYLTAHADEGNRWKEIAREILRLGRLQGEADVVHAADRSVEENRDFAPFEAGELAGVRRKVRSDGQGDGIELEALLELARGGAVAGGYRTVEAADAIAAWREANGRVREGGPLPLAVLRRKGETRGSLVYRA